MCSTSAQRIAEIGQAIDDLAAETHAAHERADRRDADQVVIKLARLWARLAELDPEVARRMPTYEALSEVRTFGQPGPSGHDWPATRCAGRASKLLRSRRRAWR